MFQLITAALKRPVSSLLSLCLSWQISCYNDVTHICHSIVDFLRTLWAAISPCFFLYKHIMAGMTLKLTDSLFLPLLRSVELLYLLTVLQKEAWHYIKNLHIVVRKLSHVFDTFVRAPSLSETDKVVNVLLFMFYSCIIHNVISLEVLSYTF